MNQHRTLSQKEIDTLELLGKGHSLKEAASVFGISTGAVEQRVNRVRKKLGVPRNINHQAILPILALNIEKLELVRKGRRRADVKPLSARQLHVFRHIASGLTRIETAKRLMISTSTIESHMRYVQRYVAAVLGKRSVTPGELIHYALARKLVELRFVEPDFEANREVASIPMSAAGR